MSGAGRERGRGSGESERECVCEREMGGVDPQIVDRKLGGGRKEVTAQPIHNNPASVGAKWL